MNSLPKPKAAAVPALLRRYEQLSDVDAAMALNAIGYQVDADFVEAVRRSSASFVTREAYWLDLLAKVLPGIQAAANFNGQPIAAIFDDPSRVQPVLDSYPELREEFVGLSPNTRFELEGVWNVCKRLAGEVPV